MKLLAGQEFAALADKAGLSIRLVSATMECSHVTVYNYLKGVEPKGARFVFWAFAHFMAESLHYGVLPMKDIDRGNAGKVLTALFKAWLKERVEFQLDEIRPGRVHPPVLVGEGEFSMEVQGDPVEL